MGYAQRISSAVHLSYRFMRPTPQLVNQIHWRFNCSEPISEGVTNAMHCSASFAEVLHPFS